MLLSRWLLPVKKFKIGVDFAFKRRYNVNLYG